VILGEAWALPGRSIFIDGPERADCPIDARVRARFNADMEGPVSYRIACDNGATFTGEAPAKKTGPNTYIAVAAHEVQVTKSGKLACTLQIERRANHAFQWVGAATKDFNCRRSGAGDLVPETRPDPKGPAGSRQGCRSPQGLPVRY
jgi:hypothetical protein